MTNEYTTSVALQIGSIYKFKVRSRNSVGYSLDSTEVEIIAASIPDVPTGVTTAHSDGTLVMSWDAPYNGGSPITAYNVQIQ